MKKIIPVLLCFCLCVPFVFSLLYPGPDGSSCQVDLLDGQVCCMTNHNCDNEFDCTGCGGTWNSGGGGGGPACGTEGNQCCPGSVCEPNLNCINNVCVACGTEAQVCCSGDSCNSGLYCSSGYCCQTTFYWDGSMCVAGEDECTELNYNVFNTPTWYYYGYVAFYDSTGNYACCDKDGANPIIRYGQPGNYFLPITVY